MTQNILEKTKIKAKTMTNLNTNITKQTLTQVNALKMILPFDSKIWISVMPTVKN